MSKKTKRQKVIAAYRNKLRLLQKDQQSEIVTQQEKPLEKQTLNDLPKPNVSADHMLYRTYFLNDFRKSRGVCFVESARPRIALHRSRCRSI